MEIVELKVRLREHTGKKGAKACRNKGLVPGIFYGKDSEPTPLAVNPKRLDRVLHTHAGANVIIKLEIDEQDKEPVNVVVKELQVDCIKGLMRHVDFCQISLDEVIRTSVPFRVVGESPGVKEGGILEHTLWELEIESLPLDVPDAIEVDVNGLGIGDSLSVSDLTIPENVTVITDAEVAVVSIAAPRAEEVVEEVAEEEVEGAEPEVVSGEAKEEDREETKAADDKGSDKED